MDMAMRRRASAEGITIGATDKQIIQYTQSGDLHFNRQSTDIYSNHDKRQRFCFQRDSLCHTYKAAYCDSLGVIVCA